MKELFRLLGESLIESQALLIAKECLDNKLNEEEAKTELKRRGYNPEWACLVYEGEK